MSFPALCLFLVSLCVTLAFVDGAAGVVFFARRRNRPPFLYLCAFDPTMLCRRGVDTRNAAVGMLWWAFINLVPAANLACSLTSYFCFTSALVLFFFSVDVRHSILGTSCLYLE